jgi:hypothetical protein
MEPDVGEVESEFAQVVGLRILKRLEPWLSRLHDNARARDKAGNRKLFFDQLCLALLIRFFNPSIKSLRALQRVSELPQVRKKLGCSRFALGSLSEAMHVFDPELLEQIIAELSHEAPRVGNSPQWTSIPQQLTVVDGTLLRGLPQLTAAALLTKRNGKPGHFWRIHTHFDLGRHIPTKIRVTAARNSGPTSERSVLRSFLATDHCYLLDRGYADLRLFDEVHAIGSSYVCRVRNDTATRERELRPLSAVAREAHVVEDALVVLGSPRSYKPPADHTTRLVTLEVTPHPKRSRRTGETEIRDRVLLVTNLIDVPAETIALMYRYRWQIELFFRFFKHLLGCRHLLSQCENGIAIQTYCAIIACLLLGLYTQRKPTQYTLEMIQWYLIGWATEDDLEQHLAKLKTQDA